MSSTLPERASLEYLKKVARQRLQELRRRDPETKLAAALLDVAREYGFSSWRALKAEVEIRQAGRTGEFFRACAAGDAGTVGRLLALEPELARSTNPAAKYAGWTGLHTVAESLAKQDTARVENRVTVDPRGHIEAIRLLLHHGADPNAREAGDHTYALHWAAAAAQIDSVRLLLDAGTDPHGRGDDHELDVIGWATFFRPDQEIDRRVVDLLVERGAHHHIISAVCVGDLGLIRALAEADPGALDRRLSRFEGRQTALHLAIGRKRYDVLELLIELGADLEAEDGSGCTALARAAMQADAQAMRCLIAAGAKDAHGWAVDGGPLPPVGETGFPARMAGAAKRVGEIVPMISAPDIGSALTWYASIGFREIGRYPEGEQPEWGMIALGEARVMFMNGPSGEKGVRLWFYTEDVGSLYEALKARQLWTARAAMKGKPASGVAFLEDLYDPPYGGRQFSIHDLNGYTLVFYQTETP